MHRRAFLTAVGVGATGLAGCGGQDGDVPAGEPGDGESTPESTPSSGPSGSTPSGSTPEDGAGSTDERESANEPVISNVQMQPANSYRFRFDVPSDGDAGPVVAEGRWYEGDMTTSMTVDGQNVVSTLVDGTYYYESGGECFSMESSQQQGGVDTQQWADTDATTSDLEDWQDLMPTGTATIDGEQMHVFELTPEEHDVESTVTYYVSTETGYFRRLETQGAVVDYWDWGNADPIQAPC